MDVPPDAAASGPVAALVAAIAAGMTWVILRVAAVKIQERRDDKTSRADADALKKFSDNDRELFKRMNDAEKRIAVLLDRSNRGTKDLEDHPPAPYRA